jgi:hypothetical protein
MLLHSFSNPCFAKALRLTIPNAILVQVSEVIK